MPQTQSVKEKLTALNDQLKSAAGKQDEQAKAAVRTAMTHADAAKAEIQAQIQSNTAADNTDRQAMLKQVEEVAQEGKAALQKDGAELHEHITRMMATTKDVLTKG